MPPEYRAEAVIEGFKKFASQGINILIPRAEIAREILPEKLREMGANVEVATTYRTVADRSRVDQIKEMFIRREIDIVTFTSSSTVKNFVKLLGDLDLPKLSAASDVEALPAALVFFVDEGQKAVIERALDTAGVELAVGSYP